MAALSSSCEVVDLALAASCDDDATSQLFFSGGGGDSSWPAAAEIESKLTKQESLVALCDKYGVPREFKPVCAATLGCGVHETPPKGSNALCVYSDALEAGLRLPLHGFYLKLLRHYRLAPSQLVPNAWKYMAAFVLRCKDAGVEPLVSAFRYFFSVCAHKRKDTPLGWYHFTPCAGRPRLFSGTLPTRFDWKTRFFFLRSPEGMPWKCPVAWGKPRMEDARMVELTDAAMEIDKLKQMPCVDFKHLLSLHAPPVGALHSMAVTPPMPQSSVISMTPCDQGSSEISTLSPSCEIVDLAVAATNDDATSKLFFSKGVSDDDLSWPAAAKIESKLTSNESLLALCDKYGVPRELEPVCAATLGCAACDTPTEGQGCKNALCIYADALEAGLRFPMPVFYQKLLRHYGLAPSQLTPNAWAYMAAFVRRCKDAGVEEDEPLVSAFTYFFSLCAHRHKDTPLGWHHFHPCAGRHRLFSGSLFTKNGWRTRFLFLRPPEGMPWRCPVAWGKPRREDVGVVKLTNNAAIEKLKKMPCLDLQYFLRLHDPPVGALNMLQLRSTTAPPVKPESAAAVGALTSLRVTLEAGARATSAADAASDGDGSTRRKRRRPGPVEASVTMTSWMPSRVLSPQGLGMTPCETSSQGAWGSSEISKPPGIWPSGMYDALAAIDDAQKARLQDNHQQATYAKAAQEIAYLQGQLQQAGDRERQANAAIAKFMDYLVAARAENAQLREKIAKLNQEHDSEVAKLQDEHYKAITAHAEKVKADHTAEIAKNAAEVAKLNQEHDDAVTWLMKEHEVDIARVKHAAEEAAVDVVHDAKKDIVLALFPDLDTSLL